MIHLYGVHYSPWTERARWALRHHGIDHRYHEHVPMLGEPLLRLRARRAGADKATVPLLVADEGAEMDSLAIMQWADRRGSGARLVVDAERTRAWRERLRPGLEAGRARATGRILRDPEALRESALATSPALFAGALRPLVARGCRFIGRKYGADLQDEGRAEGAIAEVLDAMRERLAGGELMQEDGFGADDILAATMLQFVLPVDASYIPLRPATRRAWTCERLASDYEDLIAWRDRLYGAHRGRRRQAA